MQTTTATAAANDEFAIPPPPPKPRKPDLRGAILQALAAGCRIELPRRPA